MAAGRIAIVGGGLAGLSAGVALKRAGFEVRLFERSRLLGGKATSFVVDGHEVDNGQHVYLACCTEFIDFVQETANVPHPLILQDRFDALLFARGKPPARLRAARLPAPLHLAPALLRYGLLPVSDRIRIARAVMAARRAVDPAETFAGWLTRHGQNERIRAAFWDPFLVPALNAPPEEAAAKDALFVIRTAFLSDAGAARFGYSRQPLARIAEAAAANLDEVRLRSPVAGLDIGPAGFHGIVLEDGERIACDGAVLAIPPARLTRILGSPEEIGVSGLDSFRTAPIADVHLWYDVESFGFDFAALLGSPVQWVFEKGRGYLCCSMSAADAYIGMPNEDLVRLCDGELRTLLPGLSDATLLRGAATRDREATFIPTPGLRRPGNATSLPQVAIAGAWTDTGWPATMESAVRSGRGAAALLAAAVTPRREVAVG